jgi:hypothetical protein
VLEVSDATVVTVVTVLMSGIVFGAPGVVHITLLTGVCLLVELFPDDALEPDLELALPLDFSLTLLELREC